MSGISWYKGFLTDSQLTDGCASQYKSCHAHFENTHILERCPGLVLFIVRHAPTSGFKCNCDGLRNDDKYALRTMENAEVFQ